MAWRTSAITLCALLVLAFAGAAVALGAFTTTTSNAGNELRSAPDFAGPTASASVIQKTAGGTPGYIKPGGTYRVLANVADSGNPASGTASVTANVNALSSGQTAAALTAGTFTAGTGSFNFRGASLTAASTLAAGTYAYTLGTADVAGNARTQSGFSVVVDGTPPTATAISAVNHSGGIAARPELGDVVTLTYSEPIDPNSVLAGWTGAATSVVVRIDNDAWPVAPVTDTLSVYNAGNTAALPLGSVDLGRRDYVSANRTFGAGGTAGTMTLSGNAIVIVLGTASGTVNTAGGTGTLAWTPSVTATDRAGNGASTTARSESGAATGDF